MKNIKPFLNALTMVGKHLISCLLVFAPVICYSQIPAAPTTLVATTNSTTQINLTWADASTNETGFQVERSLTTATGFTLVGTTAANAVSFANTGLTAGTRYFYRIRAINATGNSAYTAEANATASLIAPTT
ncbi:MAG: fibronectin type III domain-containing protein, partial [Pseudomonadota bacterium]